MSASVLAHARPPIAPQRRDGRRAACDTRRAPLTSSREALDYFDHLRDSPVEKLAVLLLDDDRRVIGRKVVAVGDAWQIEVDPRAVFAPAIKARAAAVVLAHSHPGDDASPSDEDRHCTAFLRMAGRFLCIEVLDHLIVSGHRSHSLGDWPEWGPAD